VEESGGVPYLNRLQPCKRVSTRCRKPGTCRKTSISLRPKIGTYRRDVAWEKATVRIQVGRRSGAVDHR